MKISLPRIIVGIFSELLVICAILLVLYLVLTWLGIPTRINTQQSITVDFKDASQLAPGSPVRWMGVDVGYVESVKPDKDHIVVRMRTEPGTPRIPHGSHFTIEFNGLAGAKSLEITQPEKRQYHEGTYDKGFDIQKPIRLQDVQDTSIMVAEGLEYSLDNIRKSLEEIEHEMPLNKRVKSVNQDLKHFTANLTLFDSRMTQVQKLMQSNTDDVVETLNDFNKLLSQNNRSSTSIKTTASEQLGALNNITSKWSQWFDNNSIQKNMKAFAQSESLLLENLQSFIKESDNHEPPAATPSNTQALHLTPESIQQGLQNLKESTEKFVQTTNKLNQPKKPDSK